jgi:hypothetical protein
MATERINDLWAFKGFIEEKLSSGETDLTLDEALMNWELENQTEEEREETLRAIRLGLDDMYAGRTVDAFEFVERMRQKFESPAKP